jgi:glycosyltransferase involved in cell wall biosynthesis
MHKKHKIVYLSDDFPPTVLGGAGMIAYEEAMAMSKLGHTVVVLTTTKEKAKEGQTTENGLNIYRLYSDYHPRWRGCLGVSNYKLVNKVEEILSLEKPDIVHTHNVHTHLSFKSIQIASKYAQKVFVTAHDTLLVNYGKFVPKNGNLKASEWRNFLEQKFRYNPFRTLLIKTYLKKVTAVIAVSNALGEFLLANGIPRVHTLHNGIELSRWQGIDEQKKSEIKSRYGLQDKKVILFAGRVSGLKGGKAILDIFKKVREQEKDARLLIVGTTNLDLPDGVITSGTIPRDEMKYMYSIADVVAVPSLYLDPFPTINLEAMASAKPVVATIYGGTKEAIQDGVNGYIVDPNNPSQFAEKIGELLKNPEKAKAMGAKGYELFIKEFTIENHIQGLLAWYNGLQK